jgi:hypothetical protein
VIGQQVDFINVEHAAVSLGQYTGGKLCAPLAQGGVQVEGADQPFFGGAERQGDELAAGQQIRQATGQR